MVLGLSKTAWRGTPPKASNASMSARTSDSIFSSGTTDTCEKRENFSRAAKKRTISQEPSA